MEAPGHTKSGRALYEMPDSHSLDVLLSVAAQQAAKQEEMQAALLAGEFMLALQCSCQLTGLDPTTVLQAFSHSLSEALGRTLVYTEV